MWPGKTLFLTALIAFAAVAAPSAQQKFQVLGPNECLNCHDHDAERQWYEKKEIPEVQRLFPDKGANAGHINSLKQLETKKSNDFAKAIGLADKYDLKGACVKCHATVFAGDANAGVSCESCHGPASGYLKPHQTKGAYDQSVAQYGMTKLVGNLQAWSQQCTSCHVMDDKKLVDAGHPAGDDFDLGKRYGPVSLHFKKMYAAADVSAIGRTEMDALLRKRGGGTAPAAAAAPPTAAPVPVAPTPPAPAAVAAPAPPAQAAPAPRAAVTAPAAPPQAVSATAAAPVAAVPAPVATPPPAAETAPAPAPTLAPAPLPPPVAAVVTPPSGFSGFLQSNWQWLWAVIVIPVVGILWWRRSQTRGR